MNFLPWQKLDTDLGRARRLPWPDLLIVAGIAGIVVGGASLARQSVQVHENILNINLHNPLYLIKCTFYSLCRGVLAYGLSLAFTLVYGYWAAKDRLAERVLVPLLDILQSIPVLSFLPGVVIVLANLFPDNNVGLELACILMIFTGQVWNMTFSYLHSLKSVPLDMREAATVFRLNWWRRLKWVELPFATMGLVWNSMMSMAGGWFFLSVCEAFSLKKDGVETSYRVPGIGSYVTVAVKQKNYVAMVWAIIAMIIMIVLLDQLLWRPVVVWAQRFRIEEGASGPAETSWFLRWLRRSRLVAFVTERFHRKSASGVPGEMPVASEIPPPKSQQKSLTWVSLVLFVGLILLLGWGGYELVELLRQVAMADWVRTVALTFLTLLRVFVAVALGTLWTVPAGIAIGLSPRLSRMLQPVIQVAASFPAPMLFPLVVVVLKLVGMDLNFGSILLMLLGTQWYILFNVVAGAMTIPADLREAARSFNIVGRLRWWKLYLPAVFPALVTGWVTAAGGAWNASIVSEFMSESDIVPAVGIGAQICKASADEKYALLAASTLVLSLVVVGINRTLWRYCYRLAETRYSASK